MSLAEEFRRRASFEARRYGGDPWVFVRELLQNSRDAGASRIDLHVERREGIDRVVCRDDGCGMTFDHAKRYLFTLYASSKTGEHDTAGRFGIGFWSVLRFRPDRVVVSSAPTGGPSWQLGFSGDLRRVERGGCDLASGTRIELSRASRGADPVAGVWRAARRDARHLRRRGKEEGVLDVRVNGRRSTAEVELDPPSLTLVRPGMRGAVALANTPEVDLLAHGLRVRTAATLDELLTRPETGRRRRPVFPSGLLPRVVLDSSRLQVLMARGDARTDRELRRLVAFGRRGVRRLVREQLDRNAGLGPLRRLLARGGEFFRGRWIPRVGVVVLAAVLLVAVGWLATRSGTPVDLDNAGAGTVAPGSGAAADSLLAIDAVRRYRGPTASRMGMGVDRLVLGYRPPTAEPLLVVFRVQSMDDRGRVVGTDTADEMRPYTGSACHDGCLDFVLTLDGAPSAVRLPVPTGHVLDPASIRIEDGSAMLWATADGVPLLAFDGRSARRIAYRTGIASEASAVADAVWPALPREAEDFASRLRPLAPTQAASLAEEWVQRRVVYDTSPATALRHREVAASGRDFAQRCLMVGAGDCDVQNALVAAILHRSGVDVRMAVGFVGASGRALPGLHAWVEYRTANGIWHVADASRGVAESSRAALRTGGPTTPPARVESGGDPTRRRENPTAAPADRAVLVVVVGSAVVAVVAMLWVLRRREIATVVGDGSVDLAGLLGGALATPNAFGEIPALFTRPVVPMVGGPSISLRRARTLGHRGMLAVGSSSEELVRRATDAGADVIDAECPEGPAVAAVLGAVDLDRWGRVVAGGVDHPLIRRLERAAAEAGEDWSIFLSVAAHDVEVLEGRLAGGSKRSVMVAVGSDGEPWHAVEDLAERSPSAATLFLAEHVLGCIRVQSDRARRLVSRLAAAALSELEECGS